MQSQSENVRMKHVFTPIFVSRVYNHVKHQPAELGEGPGPDPGPGPGLGPGPGPGLICGDVTIRSN